MSLCGNAETYSGEGEVLADSPCYSNTFDRVFLMFVSSTLKGILKQHVSIERIELWSGAFLGITIVEWYCYLCLFREEFTQFQTCGDRISAILILCALCHFLLQTTKAIADIFSRSLHTTQIRELNIEVCSSSPTSFTFWFE